MISGKKMKYCKLRRIDLAPEALHHLNCIRRTSSSNRNNSVLIKLPCLCGACQLFFVVLFFVCVISHRCQANKVDNITSLIVRHFEDIKNDLATLQPYDGNYSSSKVLLDDGKPSSEIYGATEVNRSIGGNETSIGSSLPSKSTDGEHPEYEVPKEISSTLPTEITGLETTTNPFVSDPIRFDSGLDPTATTNDSFDEPEVDDSPYYVTTPGGIRDPVSFPNATDGSHVDSMIQKPEPEPGDVDLMPDPEPEPGDVDPMPEPIPEGETFDYGIAFAEPVPVWTEAMRVWGIAWYLHVYCLGCLFSILSSYCVWSMVRIRSFTKLLSRQYFISLNLLMFIVCCMRAFYLFYDPYNSSNRLPLILSYFVFNTGFPFFTSSFAVLFLSLLQATKLRLLSPKIQKPSILATIIGFHFLFSVSTDVIVGTLTGMTILVTVCQIMFIAWAVCLSVAYIFVFRRLYRSAKRSQAEMMRTTFTSIHIGGGKLPKKLPRPTLGTAVKVTLLTAFLGMCLAALQIYGMVDVYGLFVLSQPKPWPWLIYQTLFRLFEVSMCITMIFVASQPLRHFNDDARCLCPFKCCDKTASYYDAVDVYPAHLTRHLRPMMTVRPGRTDIDQEHSHSKSLPGYAYRGNAIEDSPEITSGNFALKYMSAAPLSNASVISAISSNKCNTFIPAPRSDGVRSTVTLSTASGSRPSSMLVKDNGFIRFRSESDPVEESDSDCSEISDDNVDEQESLRPHVGSAPDESILNDEISPDTSPFFRNGYKPYYNNCVISGYSEDTTDMDTSAEQLSELPRSRAFDSRLKKYGSTCSSESAGNSFDVSIFLRSVGVQTMPCRPFSDCVTEDGRYRPISVAVTEDEDGSSIDGHHEAILEDRISGTSRPDGLNLNFNCKRGNIPFHVVGSPMQDITPDSAVYLDLHIPKADPAVILPQCKRKTYKKQISCSQSMNDLTKSSLSISSSYQKIKKSTESLLNRIRGSTFSLHSNLDGYKLLKSTDDDSKRPVDRGGPLRRTLSERQKRLNRPVVKSAKYKSMCDGVDGEFEARLIDGDSGLLAGSRNDLAVVDEYVQTDPIVIQEKIADVCTAIKQFGSKTVSVSENTALTAF